MITFGVDSYFSDLFIHEKGPVQISINFILKDAGDGDEVELVLITD